MRLNINWRYPAAWLTKTRISNKNTASQTYVHEETSVTFIQNLRGIILSAKNIQTTVPKDTVVNSDKITKSLLSTLFFAFNI